MNRIPRLAVMLLVRTGSGRFLMHLRDDRDGVLHAGCWAGFGGSVEAGESPAEALVREVLEETGLKLEEATFLTQVVDEHAEGGRGDLVRIYVADMDVGPGDIKLTEGAGVGVFSFDEIRSMRLSPFVRRVFASQEGALREEP